MALALAARRVIDEQAVERIDLDVGQMSHALAEHFAALGHGEERVFMRVLQDGYYEFVGNARGPRDKIQVPVGGRIKRARIDGEKAVRHDC